MPRFSLEEEAVRVMIPYDSTCRLAPGGHAMKFLVTSLLLLLLPVSLAVADDEKLLFDFSDEKAAQQWQAVNDGVMGGRSSGTFQIKDKNLLKFTGVLSLENNGGFASIRSRPTKLNLRNDDTLTIRVKGDGRTYYFNLYVPTRLTAFSYRLKFPTKQDKWTEVQLPLSDFQATWFGREVNNRPLDATQVNSLGILLADKKAGPFDFEIDWIKVRRE